MSDTTDSNGTDQVRERVGGFDIPDIEYLVETDAGSYSDRTGISRATPFIEHGDPDE